MHMQHVESNVFPRGFVHTGNGEQLCLEGTETLDQAVHGKTDFFGPLLHYARFVGVGHIV